MLSISLPGPYKDGNFGVGGFEDAMYGLNLKKQSNYWSRRDEHESKKQENSSHVCELEGVRDKRISDT